MKKAWSNFLKVFQPKYAVVINMYHVIPGRPVLKYEHRHEFGKGELDQASFFFQKVVKKHNQLKFPNSEVYIVKGKGTVIEGRKFGPVDMVKGLRVKSKSA